MRVKDFLQNHLHHYLSTALLYNVVAIWVSSYYDFNISVILIILFTCLWVAAVSAFDNYKHTPIPYLIVGIIVISFTAICYKKQIVIYEHWSIYLDWLTDMALGNDIADISDGIALVFTLESLIYVFILSTPIYFIVKARILRLCVSGIGIVTLIVILITKYPLNHIVAAFIYSYLFLCVIELCVEQLSKKEKKDAIAMTTFLSPFAVALFLILASMPSSQEPMEFRILKNVWGKIVDLGNEIAFKVGDLFHAKNVGEFSLTFSGFSEDALLSDGVASNEETALIIKNLSNSNLNLYLTGNIKNEFVGNGWVYSVPEDKMLSEYTEYELDLYELINAISLQFPSFTNQNVVHNRTLNIEYNKHNTRTLFYPSKLAGIEKNSDVPNFYSDSANLILKDTPDYHASYKAYVIELRFGSKAVDQFLTKATTETYSFGDMDDEKLRDSMKNLYYGKRWEDIDNLGDILETRAKAIQENYTKLPDSVSKRVMDLSVELTKDVNSGYEKMRSIEAYLNSLSYTTHPKKAPQGVDLLDYFLFESKEGYCTYFATAMAVMGRCIGIPTRYVQGYCLPVKSMSSQNEVTGNEAHAWVEAYFKGVGWIAFEPTAGYSEGFYKSKDIYDGEKLDMTTEYTEYYSQQAMEHHMDLEPEVEEIPKDELTTGKTYLYVIVILIGVVLLVLVVSSSYVFFRIQLNRSSYKKASGVEQQLIRLRRILILIQYFKFCSEENPTLLMQFTSLNEEDELAVYRPVRIAEYYMRLCYSDRVLNEDEAKAEFDFYCGMLEYLKQHTKKLKYYFVLLKLR